MTEAVSANGDVDVSVKSFASLFRDAKRPLAIDTYQRPFVWGTDKVNQLVADIDEYCHKTNSSRISLDYYMGAILLHEDIEKNRLFIIDGQQRLTSLCLLYHFIMDGLPENQALHYHSPISVANIKQAQELFEQSSLRQHGANLFNHICFTVITVQSEDLAFNFFDTQNNRGVPLQPTDLLKAYHLRAINGRDHILLQTNCAERWERLQGRKQILGHGADFAPTLFHQFLWRARRWTGQKEIKRESYNDIIAEFQNDAIRSEAPDSVPLYTSRSNRLGSTLTLLPQKGYRLEPLSIRLSNDAAELPFAIRQPISMGIGFFLYAEKYTALIKQLLEDEQPDPEVHAFRNLYDQVIADISLYLRELFLLASVMYIDQFGHHQLFHFALWLDHVLGAIRLEKQYIFKEAPLIFLRDSPYNLLDVITSAFRPEEVIAYLKKDPRAVSAYDKENIVTGKGVQGRYKKNVLVYYGYYDKMDNLKGKAHWIDEKLIEENQV
ncbi:DUF262 domain-containing protein [Methanosarcina sp. DH2]|uniref:DUF262 domain-containing protein n=1 Tax=Methanosarcina sp. DH2 TaxID=2605639 RepID=UPI001E581899|nr:DUF262 domain-containing protein [Methanosarcina sp. DH2]MCC4771140.1 DUF262 domain-containing protein [Methanosarcina sp. DH2]